MFSRWDKRRNVQVREKCQVSCWLMVVSVAAFGSAAQCAYWHILGKMCAVYCLLRYVLLFRYVVDRWHRTCWMMTRPLRVSPKRQFQKERRRFNADAKACVNTTILERKCKVFQSDCRQQQGTFTAEYRGEVRCQHRTLSVAKPRFKRTQCEINIRKHHGDNVLTSTVRNIYYGDFSRKM